MKKIVKTKVRQTYVLNKIKETMVLDRKLLWKQINIISRLTAIVNNEIGDNLVGAEQVLETFEWLPKGEYVIKVKIQ